VPLLGIDIGGTRLKAGLVTREGAVIEARARATPVRAGDFERTLAALIDEVAPAAAQVEAVGIACKGVIDNRTTRVDALPGPLQFLEGRRLADLVERPVPVAAENDARAAMAGEMAWGAARGHRDALLLTLGTGVGGAVLADGRLLRGATGVGGHLGHITLDARGPVCLCGNHGCLETFFSARAIEAEAVGAILRGAESVLLRRYLDAPASVTCEAVFTAAAEGDEVANLIVDRAIERLAAAVAGLLLVFDPEVVILAGQISAAGERLFQPLRQQLRRRTFRMLRREVPLKPAQVSDAVVGAAALVLTASSPASP